MKRFLTALLSFIFLLSAASCSIKGEPSQATETTTTASLATSAVSRETTAATSETKPAPPDVTGRYLKKNTVPEMSDADAFCLEMISKDGKLGVLFKFVFDDFESCFNCFSVEPKADSNTVSAVYNDGTVHIKLTSDGKTADVVYQGNGEDGPFSGCYERQDPENEKYIPDFIAEPICDTNTPNGAMDRVLACAAREKLGLPPGAVLTEESLSEISELFICVDDPFSLNGIEYFTGLQNFAVKIACLKDISPLAKVSSLKEIRIIGSYIDSIPDLSNCKDLSTLIVTNSAIRDITPVTKIRSLTCLDLSDNLITSIAPIKDMDSIKELDLSFNPVSDWETISGNEKLIAALPQNFDYDAALSVIDKADGILKEILKEDMSELEKEIAIYKKIQDITVYDEKVHQMPEKPAGYYLLMEGFGVCEDYADAMAILMNRAGMECFVIDSNVDPDTGMPHAWNIVKIDGEYYEADCTWDDGQDPVDWQYFNISRARMDTVVNHHLDRCTYPVATHSMMQVEYLMLLGQL